MGKGEIIFIILSSANKNRVVCDIVEKCFHRSMNVLLVVEDVQEAKKYDQLLWTWKQASFIPHIYINTVEENVAEPVVITNKLKKNHGFDVLIMVDPVPVQIMLQFHKIIDFAEKYDLARLDKSRQRYKEFRKENFTLKTMQAGEFLSSKI
jgi:DNA polymerase-3 subunit chi